MKKSMKVSALVILVIFVILFLINIFTERSIKTEIVINASPEKVWEVLLDHQKYPEWNPFIKNISGSTLVGENLSVTVQSEGNDPMDFTPIVLINKKNQEFRWVGKLVVAGVFDGEHYFITEAINPNQTKFSHGENFTGILSGMFMGLIRDDTEKGFNSMNEALKLRVENN